MPDAPNPITSPPAHPYQPYDATAPGSNDSQSDPTTVYDAAGGSGSDPWVKIQEAGAAGRDGTVTGGWPDDGDSSGAQWKQT